MAVASVSLVAQARVGTLAIHAGAEVTAIRGPVRALVHILAVSLRLGVPVVAGASVAALCVFAPLEVLTVCDCNVAK